jgi:hypothetical protein
MFAISTLPVEAKLNILHRLPTKTLVACAFIKALSQESIEMLHTVYYINKVIPKIGSPTLLHIKSQTPSIWSRICLICLCCLQKREYSQGAPRLFYMNTNNDLLTIKNMQSLHPNPKSKEWNEILECTMDYCDFIQNNIPSSQILQRYSERMDMSTFLLFLKVHPEKNILLRCKPVGNIEDLRVVIWDEYMFGYCEVCKQKLERNQVCADCKVVQYCSRECQKLDWVKGHKETCKGLIFSFTDSSRVDNVGYIQIDPFIVPLGGVEIPSEVTPVPLNIHVNVDPLIVVPPNASDVIGPSNLNVIQRQGPIECTTAPVYLDPIGIDLSGVSNMPFSMALESPVLVEDINDLMYAEKWIAHKFETED